MTSYEPDTRPHDGSLPAGTRLNEIWEIEKKIAAGGMGEVYRGHNIHTGDAVAIKVVRIDIADADLAMAMFRKEAAALNELFHEAIVRYYLFSLDPVLRRPYLVMEFVSGRSLKDIIAERPLGYEAARILTMRVAAGLAIAHDHGIFHRDVSPDNIILPGDDPARAKIIDFGIARHVGTSQATLIGQGFAGKYGYVSPEQLGLYGGEVGAQSDIYSLALVLAQAVTGVARDMRGNPIEVIEKRRRVPDLADVDPRLRPILEWMLQPDPADRPASMREVEARLRDGPASVPQRPASEPAAERTVMAAGHRTPDPMPAPGFEPQRPSGAWVAEPGPRPDERAAALAAVTGGGAPSERPAARPAAKQGSAPAKAGGGAGAVIAAGIAVVLAAGGGAAWWLTRPSEPKPVVTSQPSGGTVAMSGMPGTAGMSGMTGMAGTTPSGGTGGGATGGGTGSAGGSGMAGAGSGSAPLGGSTVGGTGAGMGGAMTGGALSGGATGGMAGGMAGDGGASGAAATVATGPSDAMHGNGNTGAGAGVGGERKGEVQSDDAIASLRMPGAGPTEIERYLADYARGNCIHLAPSQINAGAVETEAYGSSVRPFEVLDADFKRTFGYPIDILLHMVTPEQCGVVDLLARAGKLGGARPKLELSAVRIGDGGTISGSVSAKAGESVAVAIVEDDGRVRMVQEPAVAAAGGVGFRATAGRRGGGGDKPQLVVAIASSMRLSLLETRETMPASLFAERLEAEARAAGAPLRFDVHYLVVTR